MANPQTTTSLLMATTSVKRAVNPTGQNRGLCISESTATLDSAGFKYSHRLGNGYWISGVTRPDIRRRRPSLTSAVIQASIRFQVAGTLQ
jgi:hypothetical protein